MKWTLDAVLLKICIALAVEECTYQLKAFSCCRMREAHEKKKWDITSSWEGRREEGGRDRGRVERGRDRVGGREGGRVGGRAERGRDGEGWDVGREGRRERGREGGTEGGGGREGEGRKYCSSRCDDVHIIHAHTCNTIK